MGTLNEKRKMQILVDYLRKANIAYANGTPIIDDAEWNDLFDELKKMEDETGIVLSGSPTHSVGYEIVDEINKVEHKYPMLSLDKIHTIEEIKAFCEDYTCVMSVKLDGLSLRIIYNDGVLSRIETRGNGEVGSDVTFHKSSFLNIPLEINTKGTYIIDGECLITYSDFETVNEENNNAYENPRNLAAGTLNCQDSSVSSQRRLRFIAWNVIEGENLTNSLFQNLEMATDLGFDVVPHIYVEEDELEEQLELMKKFAQNKDFPMDGAVIAYDDIAYGKSLGRTAHHFKSGIAYKYEDEKYETELVDIEWTMGTNKLTPVAIVQPVQIDGSTIVRASLHNLSYIKKLKLGIGDTVTIYKSNSIIPQIAENLTQSNTLEIPRVCPYCLSPIEIRQDGIAEELYCTNPECSGKKVSKFSKFVSKHGVNIEGLSEKILEKFIKLGYLNSFADIYHLDKFKKEIIESDGFGQKSYDNLITAIENSRNIKLENYIYALGIPMVGKTASKLISKVFHGDYEEFRKAWLQLDGMKFDWTSIEGFGENIAQALINTGTVNFDPLWDNLCDEFNFILPETVETSSNDKIKDKSFCITGKLETYSNRDELVFVIEQNGGKVVSGVTKKTDYLITNDKNSGSSKNKKASELNIPVISELEFNELLK